jgi:hypothetical protein
MDMDIDVDMDHGPQGEVFANAKIILKLTLIDNDDLKNQPLQHGH